MTTKTKPALPDVANMTEAEYERRLHKLYASTPRLPLDDPAVPLTQLERTNDVTVTGSRVKLYLIMEGALELGETIDDLDEAFATVSRDELARIFDYYAQNQEIVDEFLAHAKAIGNLVEAWNRMNNGQEGLRERLWARLSDEQRARIRAIRRKIDNGE